MGAVRFGSWGMRVRGIVLLSLVLGSSSVWAITGSWTNNNSADWTNSSSWAGGVIPNYAGDVAYITNNISAGRTVTISSSVTNGAVYIGDPDGSSVYTVGGTAGTLVFDNVGNGATLTMLSTSTNTTVSVGNVSLVDALSITNQSSAYALTVSSILSGGGALSVAGGFGVTLSGSNTFSGGTVLQSGGLKLGHNFALGGGALTINGGTLDATATRTITNNNSQAWNGDFAYAGSAALNMGAGPVTLGGNRTVTVVTNTLTVGGTVDDGVNSYSLTKAGNGTLALTGTNTYGGGTVLNAGELDLNSAQAIGTGTLTINGGTLSVTVANITNINNNAQIWNGDFAYPGRYSLPMGTGPVTLNDDITITNAVSIYSGILTVGGTIDDGANSYSLTFDGVLGGLALAGANTYDGGTVLNNGRLYINHPQALGTGPLTIYGGQIDNWSGVTVSNQNNNAQNWNGNFSFYGHNTLHLGNGPVTLGASVILTNQNNMMSVDGVIDDGANSYSLTKWGNGTLALGGANTYEGGTVLNAGAIELNHGQALGTGPITINGGQFTSTITAGYSNANNNAQFWNADFALAGGRSVHLGVGPVTLSRTCVVGALFSALTVGGVIDDGGAGYGLTKSGGNILRLSGVNTYTGITTVPTGTVNLAGSGSVANSSALVVTAPGILSVLERTDGTLLLVTNQYLRGDGTVRGVVTNAGVVAPGNSAGILSIVGQYQQRGTLEIELGGTTPGTGYDVLAVSSNASLGGQLAVTTINGFVPVVGNTFTVLTANVVSGAFASTNLPAGLWTVNYQPTAVILTYAGAGGGPVLEVSPSSLNFDAVLVGETRDLILTVTNSGTAQLEGTATVSGVAFSIPSGSPFSVAAGASASVTIRFTPTETAAYAGDVTFASNGGEATNAISGSGYVISVGTNTTMRLVGGLPTFDFNLVSGALYRVQASTNLLDGAAWTDVTAQLTNHYPGGVIPAYSEASPTSYPRRAYRISSP